MDLVDIDQVLDNLEAELKGRQSLSMCACVHVCVCLFVVYNSVV